MDYTRIVEYVGMILEAVGVTVMVFGAIAATVVFILRMLKSSNTVDNYRGYRQNLGRAILLGLEFLVAGDIIRSIVVSVSLTSVAVLAIIVLIRSFLSIELEMEIEGRWPWQREKAGK